MAEAKPTVLIVDDDPAIRGALENLLRSVGLGVRTSASVPEFLEAGLALANQETTFPPNFLCTALIISDGMFQNSKVGAREIPNIKLLTNFLKPFSQFRILFSQHLQVTSQRRCLLPVKRSSHVQKLYCFFETT